MKKFKDNVVGTDTFVPIKPWNTPIWRTKSRGETNYKRDEFGKILCDDDGVAKMMPSLAMPDQTMTIRQILNRNASGHADLGGSVGYYFDDEFIPDLRKMDLVDRENYLADVRREVKRIDGFLSAEKKQKDAEEKELAIQQAVERSKKATGGQNPASTSPESVNDRNGRNEAQNASQGSPKP